MYPSPVALPTMTRFSKTSPGMLDWMLPMFSGARPSSADTQVDDTVGAERHDRFAGLRVDLLQQAVHREDQALVSAVGALPVVHAAAGHPGHVLAHPPLPAGCRVDRYERSVAAAPVDDAVHDDGPAAGISERVRPGHLQPGDVAAGDLRRREVARVVGTVAIAGPPPLHRRLRGRLATPAANAPRQRAPAAPATRVICRPAWPASSLKNESCSPRARWLARRDAGQVDAVTGNAQHGRSCEASLARADMASYDNAHFSCCALCNGPCTFFARWPPIG